jgi:hypothetical protein
MYTSYQSSFMVLREFPTVCGLWCDECNHFEKDCQGCSNAEGCAFWADSVDVEACPVFVCCNQEKGLPHCGFCEELPCERYFRFFDPDMNEEERTAALQKQITELLRRRSESE